MVAMMAVVLLFMMMYRNPAVALMPDITPKPLRAKANGIINIMGYFGGASDRSQQLHQCPGLGAQSLDH